MDEGGTLRHISDDARRSVLNAMEFATDSRDGIEAGIRRLEEEPWRSPLPPVLVHYRKPGVGLSIAVTLPEAAAGSRIGWEIREEGGHRAGGSFRPKDLPAIGGATIDGRRMERRRLDLDYAPPSGYHRLRLDSPKGSAEMPIIASEGQCYLQPHLARGGKDWGLAVQLYSLRSRSNWGVGDYADLRRLIKVAADLGAEAIGLSPLHALPLSRPEWASPYSPTSRLFFNAMYVDVESCADLKECPAAREILANAGFQARLKALRAQPLVDYPAVWEAKRQVLDLLYRSFRQRHLGDSSRQATARGGRFRHFQESHGIALEHWSVFEALKEHFRDCPTWKQWPEPYRDPASSEVAAFAESHRERVEYFEYLQWLAEGQLGEAAEDCRVAGLGVGLYHDLALGVDHESAEVWAYRHLYSAGASIGAPPDVMNRRGQNWGIAPMNWLALRQLAYEPLTAVLRTSMRYGGALRIDHAMFLQRLYWIPEGAEAIDGAYVRQPLDDYIGVLAAESQRQQCMVVGEDLGTIPPGFRARMAEARVLSYRPLYFETEPDGSFRPPSAYPALSAVVVGTHDMATLVGYWACRDIALRKELGLYPSEEFAERAFAQRAEEKRQLLIALQREGLIAPPPDPDGVEVTDALVRAVYAFLARSPGCFLMVRPEDPLGVIEQTNLPGTVFEHPNWSLKLPLDVEAMAEEARIAALSALLRECRPRLIGRGSREQGST